MFRSGVVGDMWWLREPGPEQINPSLQLSGVPTILSGINARYPLDIGSPPHEKQMLFEVKKGRHLGRRGNVGEAETPDETIASAALYMPADALNTSTAVNWDEREIGIIGGAIIESFATGDPPTSANIVEKLKDAGMAGLGGA